MRERHHLAATRQRPVRSGNVSPGGQLADRRPTRQTGWRRPRDHENQVRRRSRGQSPWPAPNSETRNKRRLAPPSAAFAWRRVGSFRSLRLRSRRQVRLGRSHLARKPAKRRVSRPGAGKRPTMPTSQSPILGRALSPAFSARSCFSDPSAPTSSSPRAKAPNRQPVIEPHRIGKGLRHCFPVAVCWQGRHA